MKLIIGLGNPGKEYENTRHNVGFRAVSRFSAKLRAENMDGFGEWSADRHSQALVCEGKIIHKKLVLLMPQTFMNDSGIAVQAAANFRKIKTEEILVVYDDKDLPFGTIRVKKEGSSGGHNGMGSIIEQLGTNKIARLRIGIGAPEDTKRDAAEYVLARFTQEEERALGSVLDRAGEAIVSCMRDGLDIAMTKHNAN